MSSNCAGILYLVATPIGNLEDITFRALETLKNCDCIYAEDTRHTKGLLEKFSITKRMESYHSFNEHGKTETILKRVLEGEKAALVTDAGMPCIADPGFLLVREAVKLGVDIVIIPGVSSLTFAVAASGLPSDKFSFYGFLPVKSGRRKSTLEAAAKEGKSVVFFESPYRMGKLLVSLEEIFGPDSSIAIIREATKIHEEVIRGKTGEVASLCKDRNWKGEHVVVIHPADTRDLPEEDEEEETAPCPGRN